MGGGGLLAEDSLSAERIVCERILLELDAPVKKPLCSVILQRGKKAGFIRGVRECAVAHLSQTLLVSAAVLFSGS